MSDLEIARIIRLGRRQGFAQACGIAFLGLLLTAPVVMLSGDPLVVAVGMAAGAVLALGVGAVITNQERSV